MAKKYALHPGFVTSRFDGEQHYIGIRQLVHLYGLSQSEYVVWDDRGSLGRREEDYIHLYPSYEGNYERPKEDG